MARSPRGPKAPANPTRGKRPGHAPAPLAEQENTPGNRAGPANKRFVSTTVEVEGREETKIVELPAFEMAPWGGAETLHIVGTSAARVDALAKVTGRARYTTDLICPGLLHAVIVRAPVAAGRVDDLSLAEARGMPGVREVISRANIPSIEIGGFELFDTTVHYASQPIAAVCAESEDAAHAAAARIRMRCTAIPHAVTSEQSLAPDAPLVRGVANQAETSPVIAERGDIAAGFAEAHVTVSREYRTPVALHSALEPHAAVADWDGEQLTVWESTQGIFNSRSDLAGAFGLPLTNVRVVKEFMGGGFGAKNGASTNAYVAAALAMRLRAPVRCVNDRGSEQTDTGNRPATVQRVTLGVTRDGRLTAIQLEADIPLGIGGWEGGPAAIYHELYSCPNVRSVETFVYLNTSAMASFRAPGHAEGAFGLECAMDALARELGMDPLALRMANYAARDEKKDRPYSLKRLDECYRQGAARFGWTWSALSQSDVPTTGYNAVRVDPDWRAAARHASGMTNEYRDRHASGTTNEHRDRHAKGMTVQRPRSTVRRGVGMASQVWGAGGGPPAYATCRLNGDGTADILTGTQDLGTGSRTIFAQIAAEELGARLEDVRVVLGDTERTPYTGNSWGSITTASVGPAVRMAAADARAVLFNAAAELLKCSPQDLVASDSVVRTRRGRRSMTFREITESLGNVMIMGHGSRGPNPDGIAVATFGAQFAEVEVDVETGIVRVLRIVAVHDAGRIINPALAESQLHGGIIQGLGYALFEERIIDTRLGVQMNPTLHDYKIPTMADMPQIDAFCIDSVDATANHVGARGLAEAPIIPTAPAIANAVANALGVEVTEIPLTPWRVCAALERAGR